MMIYFSGTRSQRPQQAFGPTDRIDSEPYGDGNVAVIDIDDVEGLEHSVNEAYQIVGNNCPSLIQRVIGWFNRLIGREDPQASDRENARWLLADLAADRRFTPALLRRAVEHQREIEAERAEQNAAEAARLKVERDERRQKRRIRPETAETQSTAKRKRQRSQPTIRVEVGEEFPGEIEESATPIKIPAVKPAAKGQIILLPRPRTLDYQDFVDAIKPLGWSVVRGKKKHQVVRDAQQNDIAVISVTHPDNIVISRFVSHIFSIAVEAGLAQIAKDGAKGRKSQ